MIMMWNNKSQFNSVSPWISSKDVSPKIIPLQKHFYMSKYVSEIYTWKKGTSKTYVHVVNACMHVHWYIIVISIRIASLISNIWHWSRKMSRMILKKWFILERLKLLWFMVSCCSFHVFSDKFGSSVICNLEFMIFYSISFQS
jgi:hypothetical protein